MRSKQEITRSRFFAGTDAAAAAAAASAAAAAAAGAGVASATAAIVSRDDQDDG